jgi:hypothetical protein
LPVLSRKIARQKTPNLPVMVKSGAGSALRKPAGARRVVTG